MKFIIFVCLFADIFISSYSVEVRASTTGSELEKKALRYGFHDTKACNSFAKSFLCVRKCLDLLYDVARTDKNCKCSCFYRRDKAKYRPNWLGTQTNWQLGAPTTKLPPWADLNVEEESGSESEEAHSNEGENNADEGEDHAEEPEEHHEEAPEEPAEHAEPEENAENEAPAEPPVEGEAPPEGEPEAKRMRDTKEDSTTVTKEAAAIVETIKVENLKNSQNLTHIRLRTNNDTLTTLLFDGAETKVLNESDATPTSNADKSTTTTTKSD